MTKYRERATGAIIEAVQFDPQVKPWPAGVKLWDEQDACPRDMSFGYVQSATRLHVFAQDWIVTDEAGNTLVYRDADFQSRFDLCVEENLATQPLAEEPMAQTADMILHIDTTEEAQALIAQLKATQDALSEDRIRQIAREEIEKAIRQRFNWLRTQSLPPYEVK